MTIKKLVGHHSASPRISTTRSDIDRSHREKGYSQIGYHAVVEGNGRIVKGRPESLKGAHAKGVNDGSLGVCLAGNFENEKPKEIQIDRLVDILVKWCREHDLTGENIYPHCCVPDGKTTTVCPGKNLRLHLDDIRNKVNSELYHYV